MSAATYQNPQKSIGYAAVIGVDGQLYLGAPAWGVSGPVLKPPMPTNQPENILATESYIMYLSSDLTHIVLIDFAKVMGIVPTTDNAYRVLQAPEPLQTIGGISAAKNSEAQWEICNTSGVVDEGMGRDGQRSGEFSQRRLVQYSPRC